MSLYEELGVPADADEDAIRKAYRKRARATHPDRNPGAQRDAFQRVALAYRVLSDPEARAKYDSTGAKPDSAADEKAQILSGIARLMLQIIDEAKDAAQVNVVEAVRAKLMEAIGNMRRELEAREERIANRERALARLKRRGEGDNLLAQLVGHEIAALKRSAATIPPAIGVNERAIELLGEYGYEVDAPPNPLTVRAQISAMGLGHLLNGSDD